MSSICLFLLFVNTILAKNIVRFDPEDAYELFQTFIKTHNKEYDEIEAALRFEIFTKNLEKINYQNERSDSAVFGITKFADLTSEEFKQRYTGYKRNNLANNFLLADETETSLKSTSIPDSFDWRDKGVVTYVKDQGQCGSCWAFSVIGNVESAYAIKTNKSVVLSEQQLVDCDKKCGGCDGGDTTIACEYLQQYGSITERSYPYKARDGRCKYNSNAVKVKVASCMAVNVTEDKLAEKLISIGPLSIAIDASALQAYHGGIITNDSCSGVDINHAVLLVGYGTDEAGIKYWLVKNSWGTIFGEDGYFRMQRGVNCLSFMKDPQITAIIH